MTPRKFAGFSLLGLLYALWFAGLAFSEGLLVPIVATGIVAVLFNVVVLAVWLIDP